MKRLLAFGLSAVLLLTGCASSGSTSTSGGSGSTPADVQSQLTQAANSVQASLQELAAIEKLQAQNNVSLPLSNINDPALNQMIAIQWYGPIEGLLAKVAGSTGYQFQVFGTPPSLPVLVNIDTTAAPASAINIIRNADLQAGLKVEILIFPSEKIMSLRYTQS